MVDEVPDPLLGITSGWRRPSRRRASPTAKTKARSAGVVQWCGPCVPPRCSSSIGTIAVASAGIIATASDAQPRSFRRKVKGRMATTQCTNRGLRVLVVDDDHDTAYSAAKLLSLHGYAARRAHNSQEAISIATAWLPDVALLDLAMPHIDGLQLARSLRKMPGLSRLELVAVIGLTGAAYRAQAEAEGFRDYLLKPVELSVLFRVFNDIAKRNGAVPRQDTRPGVKASSVAAILVALRSRVGQPRY
jgi:CheY-like chemotaxis protein